MFYVMQRHNVAIGIRHHYEILDAILPGDLSAESDFGYMPPGYTLNEINATKMLYNERWWPCNIAAIVSGGGGAAAFGKRSSYQCLTREYVESIQGK
jgi:hypothetical protein